MPGGAATAEIHPHKLFAPRQYANAIPRSAILGRIFAPESPRIVLLQGPAGHGKSTTLQQLKTTCEARGMPTGWLTFDEADNDAPRGFAHINATIAPLIGAAGHAADADEGRRPGRRRRSDWMIDQLLRLDSPAALFFDEFQTLQEKSLLQFFRALLDRLPDTIRIFIGSRSLPEIGLSRLVVNHHAMVLRGDDLRFSPAEVQEFFAASSDLAMRPEELHAIYARTEGWPAALQLYRLALVSPQVRQSLGGLENYRPRELAGYLVENVLELQPTDIQQFLLRTSLLNRLCPALCAEVTGNADSADILQRLERSGLFLRALNSDQSWFKYHGLFSFFLAEHLVAHAPKTAAEVHRRAARWFRKAGVLEEAMHHFVADRDFAAAADCMSRWASTLTAGGQLITVERWYDRLPFEEIAARPDLAIKIAYALVFLRRYPKLQPLLELLKQWAGTGEVEKTTDPAVVLAMAAISIDDMANAYAIISGVRLQERQPAGFAAFELGAAGNLAAYCELAMGNFEPAREFLNLARAYSDHGDADFSLGYTCGLVGVSLLMQGRLGGAQELFRTTVAGRRTQLEGSLAVVAVVACHIWVLYEANELEQVEALFVRYHEGIADAVLLDFLIVAYIPMVRTHDARGRPEQAVALLDEAERIGHTNGWGRLVRMVQWERVRRWLAAGVLDPALALAARLPPSRCWVDHGWLLFSEDLCGEMLARIRASIYAGELDGAARMLTQALGRQRDRVGLRIKLHVLETMLHLRRGANATAQRSLRKAIHLAQPGRMIRCFLDEGDSILRLLREAYQARVGAPDVFEADQVFIGLILQAASAELDPAPNAMAHAQPIEALTDRECEILRFLASGVSNRDMAERIFVSENTVKFHLKNIYAKLDVANRLQAVAAARHLGIIH